MLLRPTEEHSFSTFSYRGSSDHPLLPSPAPTKNLGFGSMTGDGVISYLVSSTSAFAGRNSAAGVLCGRASSAQRSAVGNPTTTITAATLMIAQILRNGSAWPSPYEEAPPCIKPHANHIPMTALGVARARVALLQYPISLRGTAPKWVALLARFGRGVPKRACLTLSSRFIRVRRS